MGGLESLDKCRVGATCKSLLKHLHQSRRIQTQERCFIEPQTGKDE